MLHVLDTLTRRHTAFGSFAELTGTADYSPSLYAHGRGQRNARRQAELRHLADAFDAARAALGSPLRAFRGTQNLKA